MKDESYDILDLIEEIENSSGNDSITRNSTQTVGMTDEASVIKLMANLFGKKNMSAKEKIDIILGYDDEEYSDVTDLLDKLKIDFSEFNDLMSDEPNQDLLNSVNPLLDDIIDELKVNLGNSEIDNKEDLVVRSANLESEAEEFSDNLFNKIYGNKE